jgi:hypothetical protein
MGIPVGPVMLTASDSLQGGRLQDAPLPGCALEPDVHLRLPHGHAPPLQALLPLSRHCPQGYLNMHNPASVTLTPRKCASVL